MSAARLSCFVASNAALAAALYLHHGYGLVDGLGDPPSTAVQATFIGLAIAGAVVLFALVAGLVWLAGRRRPGWAAGALVTLTALVLGSLWIDIRLHSLMGVHLYSPLTLETLADPGAGRELRLDLTFWLAIVFGLAAVGAVELGLWKLSGRLRPRAAALIAGAVGLVLLSSTATAMWGDARSTPSLADRRLLGALPAWEMVAGSPPYDLRQVAVTYPGAVPERVTLERRPDILFVSAESLRADMLGPELMPGLSAFAKRNQCAVAERHHSVGHTTEYGTFGLLYGLDSYHYDPLLAAKTPSWPLAVLRQNGYRLSGASASALQEWKGAGFMTAQLDDYVERVDETRWETDREVRDAAARMLGGEGPNFVFLFLNATHHNYLYPPDHARFEPALPSDYDHFGGDDALRRYQTELFNRYRNAVGWVDTLTTELLTPLEAKIQRGELIVVFTGDHGEEFWEHGMMGHAAPEFVEQRTRVPLVVCGAGALDGGISSHADIWPTVFGALTPAPAVAPTAWSSGRDLRKPAEDPFVLVGGIDFPWRYRTGMMATDTHKYWIEVCGSDAPCTEPFRTTDSADADAADVPPFPSARVTARMTRFLDFDGVR